MLYFLLSLIWLQIIRVVDLRSLRSNFSVCIVGVNVVKDTFYEICLVVAMFVHFSLKTLISFNLVPLLWITFLILIDYGSLERLTESRDPDHRVKQPNIFQQFSLRGQAGSVGVKTAFSVLFRIIIA